MDDFARGRACGAMARQATALCELRWPCDGRGCDRRQNVPGGRAQVAVSVDRAFFGSSRLWRYYRRWEAIPVRCSAGSVEPVAVYRRDELAGWFTAPPVTAGFYRPRNRRMASV